ncbi:phosphoenolpyruvate carboxylase [Pseudalkalibacillus caeni]|uniref:Phosphoenolpyruvate carboxylase n=1 Tax=Exobacillus caeni TaxID=2574798 RepID=A0A5R9F5E9_9BACL|nr:phosphoenolpyruvate carboxylase [Pseudalkalibacillus caeni]TLS38972.1 phosphoenolpyruvate carboxylase [Pseudalkalibacillus caeni]
MTTIKEPSQQENHAMLRRDVKMLGNLLGDVLYHHGGQEVLDQVEYIREMTKSLRIHPDSSTFTKLKNTIKTLEPSLRRQVIRAFAIYFHLVNIAEQNHRVRRRREYQLTSSERPQPGSISEAVMLLKEQDVPASYIHEYIHTLSLELILTAHPTEAMRRTVLEIHQRIADKLEQMDNPFLTRREKENLKETLYNEILTLWQTDELRDKKPTVMDEVSNGLFYFDETLFEVLPHIHQELEDNLVEAYPEEDWQVPNFLRFGSWIGGDRDGNPFVTPEVTWKTLEKQRKKALKKYKESVRNLMKSLSHSTNRIHVTEELLDTINKEIELLDDKQKWRVSHEVYRCKLTIMLKKLNEVGNSADGYQSAEDFLKDLMLIHDSLKSHYPEGYRLSDLRNLIRQVELFGFHLATLDIRNHSGEHEAAIHELFKRVNLTTDYASLHEEEKVALLEKVLNDPRPVLSTYEDYSASTQKIIEVFQMIKKAHKEFGPRSISVYLISMTQSASDVLEVLVLAKEAGIYRLHADGTIESNLHVAPLLETIDDLKAGPKIMKKLFNTKAYREHLAKLGNSQEIMLGYSDGSKDGGTLTANWKLYRAQQEITRVAHDYGLKLKFFHGRGGALGRGGGPLRRSILSQPQETYTAGIKITEQGEVLSSRYLLYDIAYRSLEQATSTLLQAAVQLNNPKDESNTIWENAMEEISQTSLSKYQSLVFQDPDFLSYFKEGTPLPELGKLNIGSRPMSRKGSNRFEDLRAIPWVFAWTQSRQLLPAWYAAGAGLQEFAERDDQNMELMKEMYQKWPFFRSTVDNLQMALAKADLTTAREYTNMIEDRETAKRIFSNIEKEYETTKSIILRITEQEELLDNSLSIKESIRLRNPYVDPLSFLQVEMISNYRQSNEADEELLQDILLTINGIAAGLRNTG